MAFVKKGSEMIYYTQFGEVRSPNTIIFIHGATMTGKGMELIAMQFPEFNCITVDLAGHGNSQGDSKVTVEEFADGVQYLIEKLTEEEVIKGSVVIAGYSMGGCIAVELGIRRLEQIKQIIILSSGADLKGNTPFVEEIVKKDVSEFCSMQIFENVFGRNTTNGQKKVLLQILNGTKVDDRIGYQDLVTAIAYDKLEEAALISVPTMIICGDEDKIVPVECALHLRQKVPGSALTVLPYRGHTAIFEETDFVVKTIKQFLNYTLFGF